MAQTIWLQSDSGKNGGQFLIDLDTRKAPIVVAGGSLEIFQGTFDFGKPLDLSGYDRINLIIREGQTDDTPAMVDTNLLEGSFTNAVGLSAWNSRAAYNARWVIPAGEMAYDMGDEEEVSLWMVITAFNDDSGAETILGASSVRMLADNNAGTDGGAQYMLKEVYDTNNNGKADVAELAEAVAWDDVTGKPGTFAADLTGAVVYDGVQSLSAPQQEQARDNIGAGTLSDLGASLLYSSQSLTAPQKLQALTNLGINTLSLDGAVRFDEVQSLSSGEKTQAQDNLGLSGLSLDGAVLYSAAQGLNDSQKQQARENIDAISSSNLEGAVLYDQVQALDLAEKAQARDNIGASASASEITEQIIILQKALDTVLGATTNCLQDISFAGETPTLPVVYGFVEAASGNLLFYELDSGVAVANGTTLVLPNDYDDATNDYYWNKSTLDVAVSGVLLADGTEDSTGAQSFNRVNFSPATAISILTGAFVFTKNNQTVDTEGAAATDDLATITGATTGEFLLLSSVDSARVVTVTHSVATNGIRTWDEADIVLDDPSKLLLLRFNGTYWSVIGGSVAGGGGGGGVPFDDSVAQLTNTADATKKVRMLAGNIDTATTVAAQFPNSDSKLGVLTKEYLTFDASLAEFETELLFVATKPGTIHWVGAVVDDPGTESVVVSILKSNAELTGAITLSGAADHLDYGFGVTEYNEAFVAGNVFEVRIDDPGDGEGSGAVASQGPITIEVVFSYEDD